MVVISLRSSLFTPFTDATKEIAHNLPHGVDVPDIAFSKDEITKIINGNLRAAPTPIKK